MALSEELLAPIPGENPSGRDLRYDPIYDEIREARRQDDELAQGAWQRERKVADYLRVINLVGEALAKQSKDLQLAAWLTEAWLKIKGFPGLLDGITLCRLLIETFWETLYPELEDGDAELRATPLEWLGSKLEDAARNVPLVKAGYGYGYIKYKESRAVGFEDQAKDETQKKAREKLLNEGKLAPELFERAFTETEKKFYLDSEKVLDGLLTELAALNAVCLEKFADASPAFGKLRTALEEVRHVIHLYLQKKRETAPDPVEEEAPEPGAVEAGQGTEDSPTAADAPQSGGGVLISMFTSSETKARQQMVAQVAAVAAALRKQEPLNPAPYLMMRGLRWGDLRAAAVAGDPTMLESPQTEVRQHIKRLAVQNKWKELLDAAEDIMSLPCSRAWLDLQRFVVEACVALGEDYYPIAVAIRSELRSMLHDVPQLLDATLMDDTAAANAETKAWLRDLLKEPSQNGAPSPELETVKDDNRLPARWQKQFVDSFVLAKEALRAGQEGKAFEIMHAEINRQRSPRGRFQRKLQLVELCVAAGKDAIAQPILDDLTALIDTHKLEQWEDKATMASALATIMKASKKIQGDASEKQKMFERICRLDPVRALSC